MSNRFYTIPFHIIFIGIFTSILFLPSPVFALQKTQLNIPSQNDFVVEPGKTELLLNPGEKAIKNVSVTSRIKGVTHFKLSTEDLIGSDNPTQTVILLGNEHSPYSLKDFIVPEVYEFDLALGERITFPVTISIPVDAEPRGYYGALIISSELEDTSSISGDNTQGKTKIISRIGSLFLIKVPGQGKEEGVLKDFKIINPSKLFYEKRPQGFEIAFTNSGNVHLVPYGNITIRNMIGMNVAELPVDAYFVLPDSTRYREIVWGEGFSIGRYTATLSLYKGYGNDFQEMKISFWILPWKLLIGFFGGIIIFISFIYYLKARFEIRKK